MQRNGMQERTVNCAQETRYAAIYARVSTEDQDKGFSIPTQIEAGQAMATSCTDNWQAHAQHRQPYVGRGVR